MIEIEFKENILLLMEHFYEKYGHIHSMGYEMAKIRQIVDDKKNVTMDGCLKIIEYAIACCNFIYKDVNKFDIDELKKLSKDLYNFNTFLSKKTKDVEYSRLKHEEDDEKISDFYLRIKVLMLNVIFLENENKKRNEIISFFRENVSDLSILSDIKEVDIISNSNGEDYIVMDLKIFKDLSGNSYINIKTILNKVSYELNNKKVELMFLNKSSCISLDLFNHNTELRLIINIDGELRKELFFKHITDKIYKEKLHNFIDEIKKELLLKTKELMENSINITLKENNSKNKIMSQTIKEEKQIAADFIDYVNKYNKEIELKLKVLEKNNILKEFDKPKAKI